MSRVPAENARMYVCSPVRVCLFVCLLVWLFVCLFTGAWEYRVFYVTDHDAITNNTVVSFDHTHTHKINNSFRKIMEHRDNIHEFTSSSPQSLLVAERRQSEKWVNNISSFLYRQCHHENFPPHSPAPAAQVPAECPWRVPVSGGDGRRRA